LNAGARFQRLLWASTGTKDSKAFGTLYVEVLALPFTVNTMPEATLQAVAARLLPVGVASFAKSGKDLLDGVAPKAETVRVTSVEACRAQRCILRTQLQCARGSLKDEASAGYPNPLFYDESMKAQPQKETRC
jgi:hypothetical protein